MMWHSGMWHSPNTNYTFVTSFSTLPLHEATITTDNLSGFDTCSLVFPQLYPLLFHVLYVKRLLTFPAPHPSIIYLLPAYLSSLPNLSILSVIFLSIYLLTYLPTYLFI